MEDRFRFRAWDNRLQVYAYDVQGISMYDRYEDFITFFRYVEKGKAAVTLEQCTGLKDKNGKLIYEGDIVNCSFNGKANTVETFSKKLFQGKHLVEFLEYYFSPFNYVNASDVEVVGNVHENPELLEGK